MTDDDEVDDLEDFGWFLAVLAAVVIGGMLCTSCAAVAAHPAEIGAGWLLAQFLSLSDMLALLFGF